MATPGCVAAVTDMSSRLGPNPQLFEENWRSLPAASRNRNRMKSGNLFGPARKRGAPVHILWPVCAPPCGRRRGCFSFNFGRKQPIVRDRHVHSRRAARMPHPMIHGRIETTPNQQLLELRRARDRYAALAEQTREQASQTSEEELERQQDARRILLAYEKSIANMTASMDRMHQAELLAPVKFQSRSKLAAAVISIALFGAAAYYLAGPGAHWLRLLSVEFSQSPKPAGGAAPATGPQSPLPQEAAQTGAGISPIPTPIARPDDQDISPKSATLQRPAQQIRPPQSPARAKPVAAARTDAPEQQKNGFFVKVIQPDGSFKEEFFSSAPPR
jgi:hypothetical protein